MSGWALVLMPLGGFFGAGAVSLWRTDHRIAAVLCGLVGAALVAAGILYLLPAKSL